MKTNVTYLNKAYNINPDKGVVFCMLDFMIDLNKIPGIEMLVHNDDFVQYMNKITDEYKGFATFEYLNCLDDFGRIYIRTTGIAKCSPNDNFDEELGKKIALTRTQKKAFQIAKDFYWNIFSILMKDVNNIVRLGVNCDSSAYICKAHEYKLG